ncbi:g10263 [Coccomyxa viridis]|uniref:General transcription and DNA repair factor IIH subunit TFB4 n=1 Tax=Coccomyxa viridis TaxID=1274662 RepID=A0ABP1GBZ3_9CHLO
MAQDSDKEDRSLLVILLEAHQGLWSQLNPETDANGTEEPRHLTLAGFLQQVLVFINTFLSLSDANQVAVIGMTSTTSSVLYTSPSLLSSSPVANPVEVSSNPSHEVLANLTILLREEERQTGDAAQPAALSGGLSRGLCLINKAVSSARAGGKRSALPRVLCLQGSPDATQQYIAVMNSIFAAQRSEVVIDACMLSGSESTFLQQATHLTGGIYLRPKLRGALLQYLLTIYCGFTFSRSHLELPQPLGVDFRASCFCHRRAIDMGFVCSVCLSIFCENVPECSICGTCFSNAPRTPAAKRKVGSAFTD